MLNMALIDQGIIISTGQKELPQPPAAVVNEQQQEAAASPQRTVVGDLGDGDEDGGMFL